MLFNIAKVCEKQGFINAAKRPAYVQLKQQVGQKFTEQYLFYRVIDKILADYKFQKMTGDEMLKLGLGLPDYYARKARRVFLFEFKDVQLNNEIVKSGNYGTIITAIEKAFVKSDTGRPKGVTQLANDIESHLQEMVGENFESQPFILYKESKEQYKVVPFNKYLFQKCKQKGCFYKASYIVRDVIDEMIAREKQQVSKA